MVFAICCVISFFVGFYFDWSAYQIVIAAFLFSIFINTRRGI